MRQPLVMWKRFHRPASVRPEPLHGFLPQGEGVDNSRPAICNSIISHIQTEGKDITQMQTKTSFTFN